MNDDNRKWLMRRALQAQPLEVCGFILRDDSIVEIPNSAHDPQRMFLMARHHLVEKMPNPELIQAIWHTHPKGHLRPSKSDIDAIANGAIHPTWEYIIATSEDVRVFEANDFAPQGDSFWTSFSS